MSYSKYYNPTNWENYPSEDTAINAMRLNHLEDGVDELDDRIVELSTDKSEVQWNQVLFAGQKIAEIEINGIKQDVYCSQNEGDAAAQEAALKSEGYAIGKQNGSDVSPSSPYYHNNSKYYSQQASGSATSSENNALVSEGYATGKQNGQDVPSTSPYYHNNAKYYSDLTDPTALRNMSDVDVEDVQNGQVLKWNATTEKWENGTGGGGASSLDDLSDVEIDTPSNGQVLRYNTLDSEWQNMTLINDSTTSGSTVWSSNKTNTEIATVASAVATKEDAPTILTSTLTAGSTSLTFSNAAITTTAMYDVYADKYGLTPTDITVTTGQAVLTFEAQSSNVSVKLVIR